MAEIVNLRHVRKQQARAEKERLAAENRAAHGRSKTGKRAAVDEREKSAAFIDGHRRERPDGDGD